MTGGDSLVRASRYTRWFHEGSWEGRSHSERGRVPYIITHHIQQHNRTPHPNKEGHKPFPWELSFSSTPDLTRAGSVAGRKVLGVCGF